MQGQIVSSSWGLVMRRCKARSCFSYCVVILEANGEEENGSGGIFWVLDQALPEATHDCSVTWADEFSFASVVLVVVVVMCVRACVYVCVLVTHNWETSNWPGIWTHSLSHTMLYIYFVFINLGLNETLDILFQLSCFYLYIQKFKHTKM